MKTTLPKLRRTIRKAILESKFVDHEEKRERAKRYIVDDASLFYELRQTGHPFSLVHYSLDTIRTREQIMNLLDTMPMLKGYKVVGEISTHVRGYVTYLLRDVSTRDYNYGILHVDYKTDSGVMASGFGNDFEMLKDMINYIHRGRGPAELDRFITEV